MDVKKTLKICACIVGGTALVGVAAVYIRLWIIYRRVSTIDQATQLINSPNTITLTLPDASLLTDMTAAAAAADDGNTTIGTSTDDIDAVQIAGIIYTGDADTAIYTDTSGDTYDGNMDTITDPSGDVTHIDPDSVTYGTQESDGSFVAD